MALPVSVVIPTHNRKELVRRALASVFTQSFPPVEVLVVDDGSTDGTADAVAREYPDVRLLRQENRGVSAARNTGIGAAKGDWIALLDSDDEWLPEKLERQVAAIADHRLCHCDEIWMRRDVRVNQGGRHAKAGGRIFQRCLPLCAISPSAAVIRADVFDEIGLFDEELPACEDYDFWLRFCSRWPVLFVDEELVVKHGGRDDQLSQSVWGLDRFRVRALAKILEQGELNAGDSRAAAAMLVEKIDIYSQGALRRGREAEVRELQGLRARWAAAAGLEG